ncbi:hypothetical protein KUTeg_002553 [Tegillarca granosa]|uniref:G-protein coupled receptors family 1 profile domain-containing protein n=1 Tax=Tegillarca granosa TaxID=220873 RepID=A0ABQ9FXW5_TEGGR|nr:hypothetical protein KUTeg_002553 [Tegillarca granosa]
MSISNETKFCFAWINDFITDNVTTLDDLNYFFLERHLGGIIFISIMMIIGLVGNLSVISIFATKFKFTNYRTYTIWLASLDITNCLLGMPFLLVYHTHYLTFPNTAICKGGRFVNVFTANASGFLLLVIAVDRYIHVCKPFNLAKLTDLQTKISCSVAALLGILISWPTLVLFGKHTVGKHNYDKLPFNVNGTRCWEEDSLIVRYIYKKKVTNRVQHTKKVTLILLAVTVAYVNFGLHCGLTFTEGSLLYTFVWLNLVNNTVNPIIYGYSDANFRQHLREFFNWTYNRFRRYSVPESGNRRNSE